jgi:hypothetical protein
MLAVWGLGGFAEVFLEGKISIGGRISIWKEYMVVERVRVPYRVDKSANN